jgi:hypothetical protein
MMSSLRCNGVMSHHGGSLFAFVFSCVLDFCTSSALPELGALQPMEKRAPSSPRLAQRFVSQPTDAEWSAVADSLPAFAKATTLIAALLLRASVALAVPVPDSRYVEVISSRFTCNDGSEAVDGWGVTPFAGVPSQVRRGHRYDVFVIADDQPHETDCPCHPSSS